MLTQLMERLLVRLMPYSLLDSMHVVYEDCAEFCRAKQQPPLVHAIEVIGKWLHSAEQSGWTPPIVEGERASQMWPVEDEV